MRWDAVRHKAASMALPSICWAADLVWTPAVSLLCLSCHPLGAPRPGLAPPNPAPLHPGSSLLLPAPAQGLRLLP
jgi:hypothetical protein